MAVEEEGLRVFQSVRIKIGLVMEPPAPPPPFIENWPWELWPAGLAFRLLWAGRDFGSNARNGE